MRLASHANELLAGENPQFNDAFEFEIGFPELALIRFVVLDDESLDYDFIGQFTLPFDCIQPGSSAAALSSFLIESFIGRLSACASLHYRW